MSPQLEAVWQLKSAEGGLHVVTKVGCISGEVTLLFPEDVRSSVFASTSRSLPRNTASSLSPPLQATFPEEVVQQAGAPAAIWTELRSPAGSSDLFVDVIWENKTATRLPETLWVRCAHVQHGLSAHSRHACLVSSRPFFLSL